MPPIAAPESWFQVLRAYREQMGSNFTPPMFFPWSLGFARHWARTLDDAARARVVRYYEEGNRGILPVDPATASLAVIDRGPPSRSQRGSRAAGGSAQGQGREARPVSKLDKTLDEIAAETASAAGLAPLPAPEVQAEPTTDTVAHMTDVNMDNEDGAGVPGQ